MAFRDSRAAMDAALLDKLGDGKAVYDGRTNLGNVLIVEVAEYMNEYDADPNNYFLTRHLKVLQSVGRLATGKTIEIVDTDESYEIIRYLRNEQGFDVYEIG